MVAAPKGFPDRPDLSWEDGVVLRRHEHATLESIEWLHAFLAGLAATSFPAPVPVPHFDGASVVVDRDGVVTSAVTYVPGEVVGWADAPGMFRLGRHLAEFHRAAATVAVAGQRPGAFPVDSLPGLEAALRAIGHDARPRQPIHGDFTNHNVLAAGVPPEPCGAIDFANAAVDVALFDIGCALWRSGRPGQEAHEFDPRRVGDYLDGYSSLRPLTEEDRAAAMVYLQARGVQIIVKQAARGIVDDGPRRRLAWLERHGSVLR